MSQRYDLVAIGGGTAGLIATLGVAGIGGRAALIEANHLGGDCLWTGCVPSKALLSAAHAAHLMRNADRYGLPSHEPTVDLAAVMAQVRAAQAVIEPHDSPERLRGAGVDVFEDHGRFVGPGQIQVGERTLSYRAAMISTGTRPMLPPIPGLAELGPLTSDTVWELDTLPSRLVVLGGGPIGCELGQAFARLGANVTIIEAETTLMPREQASVGEFFAETFRSEGIEVRTGVRAETAEPITPLAGRDPDRGAGHPGRLRLADGSTVEFDRILVAVGRRPNSGDVGLETVGVETSERGHVLVDDRMRTTGDRIFAAGDITGRMPFTHVAAYQARLVVTNAMFRTRRRANYDGIPWATFTDPEMARVGLDGPAARKRWGAKATVQRYDYAQLDRAIAHQRARGWVELVGDPKRRLVGATIVGDAAGEAIAEMVAWVTTGRKIDDISTTVHAYPTFAEGPSRAADEVLRARFFNPKVLRLTKPLLGLLRRIDHP